MDVKTMHDGLQSMKSSSAGGLYRAAARQPRLCMRDLRPVRLCPRSAAKCAGIPPPSYAPRDVTLIDPRPLFRILASFLDLVMHRAE